MHRSVPAPAHWLAVRLARATVWRFKPSVISVTGTAGKTTTKAAIAAVLAPMRKVRVAPDGVPVYAALLLAVLASASQVDEAPRHYLSDASPAARLWYWARVLGGAAWRVLRANRDEVPDVCVAEYGGAHQVRTLLQLIRPNVAVLTSIGDAPSPGARSDEDPIRDYARTVEQLPAAAFAVVPANDAAARLRQRTRAHVLTYGMTPGAHVQVASVLQEADAAGLPGISADLGYGGTTVPVYLPGALGPYHARAVAAAACVGIVFGGTLPEIARSLEGYRPPVSAVRVIPAVKESVIIADMYDAHFLSATAGFELLAAYPAKRRIIVLGDLIELGSRTMELHEQLGALAKDSADLLVTVGTRANIAAEAAIRARMPKKCVMSYSRAEDAAPALQDLLKKGDVVLVTGSRVMRLSTIVDEVRMPGPADVTMAVRG